MQSAMGALLATGLASTSMGIGLCEIVHLAGPASGQQTPASSPTGCTGGGGSCATYYTCPTNSDSCGYSWAGGKTCTCTVVPVICTRWKSGYNDAVGCCDGGIDDGLDPTQTMLATRCFLAQTCAIVHL